MANKTILELAAENEDLKNKLRLENVYATELNTNLQIENKNLKDEVTNLLRNCEKLQDKVDVQHTMITGQGEKTIEQQNSLATVSIQLSYAEKIIDKLIGVLNARNR